MQEKLSFLATTQQTLCFLYSILYKFCLSRDKFILNITKTIPLIKILSNSIKLNCSIFENNFSMGLLSDLIKL